MSSISKCMREGIVCTGQNVVEVMRQTSNREKVTLIVKITNLVRHIGSTTDKLLASAKYLPVVGAMKFAALPLIPLAIYNIGVPLLSKMKTTINEKIDMAFGILASIGTFGDTVATLAGGLYGVGAVPLKMIGWTTPLVVVSAVLEGMGMVLNGKGLVETDLFCKEFSQAAALKKSTKDYRVEDFSKVRELIERMKSMEQTFIAKHFKIDGDKLSQRLLTIEDEAKEILASGDPELMMQAKDKLKMTLQVLSQRITFKKMSNALSLLTASVSFTGLGLLFTPVFPAGFVLLAVSGVLSLVNFFADKAKTNQLEKDLEI